MHLIILLNHVCDIILFFSISTFRPIAPTNPSALLQIVGESSDGSPPSGLDLHQRARASNLFGLPEPRASSIHPDSPQAAGGAMSAGRRDLKGAARAAIACRCLPPCLDDNSADIAVRPTLG